jgi:hypothetical protein
MDRPAPEDMTPGQKRFYAEMDEMARAREAVAAMIEQIIRDHENPPSEEELFRRRYPEFAAASEAMPEFREKMHALADVFGFHRDCGITACARQHRCSTRHAACMIAVAGKLFEEIYPRLEREREAASARM